MSKETVRRLDILAYGFEAGEALAIGDEVLLSGDKEVSLHDGGTGRVIGEVANKSVIAGERVTVNTPFRAILEGTASGSITLGEEVTVAAVTSGTNRIYKSKADPANLPYGVALNAATNGNAVVIGVL